VLDLDSFRFEMLNPQLSALPSIIDFGEFTPTDEHIIQQVQLQNFGDVGSIIDVYAYQQSGHTIQFAVPDFDYTTLVGGDDAATLNMMFLGSPFLGEYEGTVTFLTTSGMASVLLRATVIPEPATWALMLLPAAAGLRRTRTSS